MNRRLGIVALLAAPPMAAIGLLACGAPPEDPSATGQSGDRAIVSSDEAQIAFGVARDIDYLPFGFTRDGCYARALYMAMEIAARGIPSSAQFLTANAGATLAPNDTVRWDWHVAPMVQVGADGAPTILDPSLFDGPQVARTLDAWIALSHPVPAGAYTTSRVPGSFYSLDGGVPDQPLVASFAELPAFRLADVTDACQTAWTYLGIETPVPSAADLGTKRRRLLDRTAELMSNLSERGKVSGWTEGATVPCDGGLPPDDRRVRWFVPAAETANGGSE